MDDSYFQKPEVETSLTSLKYKVESILIEDAASACPYFPIKGISTVQNVVGDGVLYNKCYESENLAMLFRANGLDAHFCRSSVGSSSIHNYVVIDWYGVEVIVDFSISQFIGGYRKIFVGTREELKSLVFSVLQSKDLSFHYTNLPTWQQPAENTSLFWELAWGNSSVRVK